MPTYEKPQSPIYSKTNDAYLYPLTTVDQVIMEDGSRLNSVGMLVVDNTDVVEGEAVPVNADTLGGKTEGELNVANAAKLNNKSESELSVNNAVKLNNKSESELSVANSAKLGGKSESDLSVANSNKLGGYSIDLLLNKIYPIGSIYLSVDSTSPNTLFGGTWIQIAKGRTLFGADDSTYIAGNTVEAGLPNITGTHSTNRYSGWEISGTGAFSGSTATRSTTIDNGNNDAVSTFIANFDASKSNALYGKSSTVQPPAFVVYMWQRTA